MAYRKGKIIFNSLNNQVKHDIGPETVKGYSFNYNKVTLLP